MSTNTSENPESRLAENEIRPTELMDEQVRRFANDVARLLKHEGEFVDAACPACGSAERTPRWKKYGMSYVTCSGCETVYICPRPPPAVLDEYYAKSENYAYWNDVIFPASEGARREKLFAPRAKRLAEIVTRHGVGRESLLEVGAGFGTFGEEMKKLGVFGRYMGVEPTPNLAATCRSRGLEIFECPVEKVTLPDASVDMVASFEVIEHIYDPGAFLDQCRRYLKPGGLMVVSCPSAKGFDVLELGALSGAVDVEHLNYFHPSSLSLLFERHGFKTLEVSTPGKLDAELVRTQVLAGQHELTDPFLRTVLIDRWAELGGAFQTFLADNQLSSHLWLVAQRTAD